MQYWLLKTEPDEYSLDDLEGDGTAPWDGIRNYQARNRLRDEVQPGDRVLIQHSGCPVPAVVGIAEIASPARPDPAQFESASPGYDPKSKREAPRWYLVDVRFIERLRHPVPLKDLRADARLVDSEPVRRGRLSVQKLTEAEFRRILELAG